MTFRTKATLSAAWGLALAAMTAQAQAEEWSGALLDSQVSMVIPGEFVAEPAHANASAASAIIEFLPPGEALDAWSQLLTMTSVVDGSGQPADKAVLNAANNLAAGYGDACPGSFAAEDLGAPAVTGADAAFAAWLACGDVAGMGHSEAMAVLVLATGGKLFTVQWAERGPASAVPLTFDMNHWLPRLDALMAFSL